MVGQEHVCDVKPMPSINNACTTLIYLPALAEWVKPISALISECLTAIRHHLQTLRPVRNLSGS